MGLNDGYCSPYSPLNTVAHLIKRTESLFRWNRTALLRRKQKHDTTTMIDDDEIVYKRTQGLPGAYKSTEEDPEASPEVPGGHKSIKEDRKAFR